MIKVIGFDLDGVLASEDYDFEVWNKIIPKAYAKKNNIPENQARDHVHAEYYRGQHIQEVGTDWFSLDYWLKRLKLSFGEVINHIPKEQEMIFEDVEETLKNLSKKYDLVLITNSVGFFREIKTKKIKKYFKKIITPILHSRMSKTNPEFWKKILYELKIKPEEMIYLGDKQLSDHDTPMSVGIKAKLIDRTKKDKKKLHSLKVFEEYLEE